MRSGHAAWAAVVAGVLAAAGCDSGPGTGDVSGTAAYDGEPIEEGTINFYPADGKSPTAGGIIKDGKYTATKVPVGTAKVTITGSKTVGKKKIYNTPNSAEMPLKIDPLPDKYKDKDKTELTFDVKSGSNEKNWDLTK